MAALKSSQTFPARPARRHRWNARPHPQAAAPARGRRRPPRRPWTPSDSRTGRSATCSEERFRCRGCGPPRPGCDRRARSRHGVVGRQELHEEVRVCARPVASTGIRCPRACRGRGRMVARQGPVSRRPGTERQLGGAASASSKSRSSVPDRRWRSVRSRDGRRTPCRPRARSPATAPWTGWSDARRAREQTHHDDRPIGFDDELPLPDAVFQFAGESFAAGLQLPRGVSGKPLPAPSRWHWHSRPAPGRRCR